MRRRAACVAAVAGLLTAAGVGSAWAEGELSQLPSDVAVGAVSTEPLRGMDERVSLDLRSAEVTDALKFLAEKGGLNIAISKNVAGRVNLLLDDVPIRDVFEIVLRSNELAYDKQGNVYNIMTEAEYRGLYGRKFADLREVRSFRLQYAIPEQAFNLLDTLKSEIGRLLVDEDSGTVLILDTPENLRQMEKALAVLESENSVKVFDLKYAKAKDVEDQLKDQLELKKLGTIKADVRSNQVIVKTLPERMDEIGKVIEALDRKTREVLIDSRIVKVTLNNSLDSGIDWNTVFANLKFHGLDQNGGDFRRITTGTAPSETPYVRRLRIPEFSLDTRSEHPPGVGDSDQAQGEGRSVKMGDLLFGTVARDGYELFRFLETIGQTKLISNPRIMATEGQEARIHVGTREAYVTTTTTAGQTTTTTAEEIEFLDVGIQLVVTPISINQDGFVHMKIKPEISSVIRTLTTPSNNKIPIVDTSTAETSVLVKDGSTVIIGGLRKDQKKSTNDHVPMLGRMPLVGNLFTQKDTDDELAELVVFITPHVVQGDQLITGDERTFGGGMKSFRGYEPVISTAPAPAAPGGAPDAPPKLRFRDRPRKGR
jgi:type II secretory pathway component GspD/PulD (secretin)